MCDKKGILLSFFVSLHTISCFGQVRGKICNLDNNKKTTVVLIFDDWGPSHYYLVTPELQSRNINATFFIPPVVVNNWGQLQTEVSYGNKIANHSETDTEFTTLTAAGKKVEIHDVKTLVDQCVTGRTTTIYTYQYGTFNNAVIYSLMNSSHIALRGVWPASLNHTYDFAATNAYYYHILTYGMDGTTTINDFYTQIKNVMNGGGLLTFLFHSVVNPTYPSSSFGTGAVDLEIFNIQLDALIFEKNKVWITTFEKAIKYQKEKKSACLSEIQAPNGVQWVLDLTDTPGNNLYNLPIKIKLKMNGVNYD